MIITSDTVQQRLIAKVTVLAFTSFLQDKHGKLLGKKTFLATTE